MEGKGGGAALRGMDEIISDGQALYDFLSDMGEETGPAELVLAMGGSDLSVAGTAAQAFFDRRAKWLVCTGGYGKDTAGVLALPESVCCARRCAALGVPEACMFVECRSANSGENFRFARALLEERGITPRTGVAACKPYMAKRAWATAAKQWPEVRWSVACRRVGFAEYLREQEDAKLALDLMVGDLQRLRVYAGTFQEPVEVPEPVWRAYERLAADGCDRFVIR